MTVRLIIDKLERPSVPDPALDALYRHHEVPDGVSLWRVEVQRTGRRTYASYIPVADRLETEVQLSGLFEVLATRALHSERRHGRDEP